MKMSPYLWVHHAGQAFSYQFCICQDRRPKGDRRYRSVGESIILGAAAAATTGDRNIPQLVRYTNGSRDLTIEPRITTNLFEQEALNNGDPVGLAQCLENSSRWRSYLNVISLISSLAVSPSMRSLQGQTAGSRFNPSFWLSQKFKSRAKRIDVMARIIFPLVFAIFNVCYWTFYLSVQYQRSFWCLYVYLF